MGLGIGEDVVERTNTAGVLVAGSTRIVFLDDLAESGVLDGANRIFHGVGVEITEHEDRVILEGRVHPFCQSLGLGDAAGVRLALAGAVVLTRALGLEVVDDRHEGSPGTLRLEALGQRLTGIGEGRVGQDLRGAHGGDPADLVDEGRADDVFVRRNDGRTGHVGPYLLTGGLVEGGNKIGQGGVAGLSRMPGDLSGVLDLLEGDDIGPQTVDRGDNLGLLVGEGLRGVGATDQAVVCRDRVAVTINIGLAVRLVLAQVGEVAQYVEAGQLDVAADRRRGGRAVVADLDRGELGVRADDLTGGLEVPAEPLVHDDRRSEVDVGAGAYRGVLGQVRQGGVLGVGVRHEVP